MAAEKAKFLGKLYVDRYVGHASDGKKDDLFHLAAWRSLWMHLPSRVLALPALYIFVLLSKRFPR